MPRAPDDLAPLGAPLPPGVPCYSLRHGRAAWTPTQPRSVMLFDDWDLFWIQRGAAAVGIGGRRFVARRDDLVLLPPLVAIALEPAEPGVVLGFCHFAFRAPPAAAVERVAEDLRGPGERVVVPLRFTAAEAPGVAQAYAALLDLPARTPGRWWRHERAIVDLVGELAAFAARRGGRATAAPPRVDDRLERMRARVAADPGRRWRVATLAAEARLSPSQLLRRHERAYGTGLKRWLDQCRMRHALTLLREARGERRVRDVAAACGFASTRHFSRRFAEAFGMTPSECRAGGFVG